MEKPNKSYSYIGFAIKARKLRTGINAISTLSKNVFLIILCSSGEKNSKKEAAKLAKRFNAPLIESKTKLEDIVGKQNCKVAAITDENLANAILQNLGDEFLLLNGGQLD